MEGSIATSHLLEDILTLLQNVLLFHCEVMICSPRKLGSSPMDKDIHVFFVRTSYVLFLLNDEHLRSAILDRSATLLCSVVPGVTGVVPFFIPLNTPSNLTLE